MKTKMKRITKSSLSMILAVLLIISTMLVGTVSVVEAANIPANTIIFVNTASCDFLTGNQNSGSIYCSVTASANSSYVANKDNTSGAANYKPKSDTWYGAMTKVCDNLYYIKITTASTVGKISFWSRDESSYDNVWQTNCSLANTYNGSSNLFTFSSGSTNHSDRRSYCYSGTWSTLSLSTVTPTSNVLNGVDVSFYIQSYSGVELGLTNGNAGAANCKNATAAGKDGYAYITVKKTDLSTYKYITNNRSGWKGEINNDISSTITGGALYKAAGSTSTTAATTATLSLSRNSVTAGDTGGITLTSTASGYCSSFGQPLTLQYYLYDGSTNTLKSSTILVPGKSASYSLDVSGLSSGTSGKTYTVKAVLNDGKIAYVAATAQFTVNPVQTTKVKVYHGLATSCSGYSECKTKCDISGCTAVNTEVTHSNVPASSTIQLTASTTNSDKYVFEGWYKDDASCSGTAASADATYSPTIGSSDVHYYALFKMKVAKQVTLTSQQEQVVVNKPINLNATLDTRYATGNLTYTFYQKKSSGSYSVIGSGQSLDAASASAAYTPSSTGTYKFKVTVSKDGYKEITSSEITVTVVSSVPWRILGNQNSGNWDGVEDGDLMTYEESTGYYYWDYVLSAGNDLYYRFANGSNQYSTTSASGDGKSVDISVSLTDSSLTKYPVYQNDHHNATFNHKVSNTCPSFRVYLDTKNMKTWARTLAGYHVITNPDCVGATVNVTYPSGTIPEGSSAGVKDGASVTVSATADDGYTITRIYYTDDADPDDTGTTITNNSAFSMPSKNITIHVETAVDTSKSTTVYVLSQYSSSVNIYLFNESANQSYTPVSGTAVFTGENKHGKGYNMTAVAGTIKVSGTTKYLYKFSYYGKADFLFYQGSNALSTSNKLTGDITACKSFTSYYFDLKSTSTSSSPSIPTATSPYAVLTVSPAKTQDTWVYNASSSYNLTSIVPASGCGGTLKSKSGVDITNTYKEGATTISSPSSWKPSAGVHTVTITTSNGVTAENITTTFKLYVQTKLAKPAIKYNDAVTTGFEEYINNTFSVTAATTGSAYPSGTKYTFTVDGTAKTAQASASYTFSANTLSLGNHTVKVKAVAPATTFSGTTIAQYVDSDDSDTVTFVIKNPKFQLNYNFKNSHITALSITYFAEGGSNTYSTSTNADFEGFLKVDCNTTVTITVKMLDDYVPITEAGSDNTVAWQGTSGYSNLSCSYNASTHKATCSFKISSDTPVIILHSYIKPVITTDHEYIKIGATTTIKITKGYDSSATYTLYRNGTSQGTVTPNSDGVVTISNIPFGVYTYKLQESKSGLYSDYSNEVSIKATLADITLTYKYRDFDTEKAQTVSYDPYDPKNAVDRTDYLTDIKSFVITKTDFNLEGASTASNLKNYLKTTIYPGQLPGSKLSSKYFDYTLIPGNIVATGNKSDNAQSSVWTVNSGGNLSFSHVPIAYTVSINGQRQNGQPGVPHDYTSCYQQKTIIMDAAEYCKGDAPNGYIWYYSKGGNDYIVSTSRYYKIRVTENIDLHVKINESNTQPNPETHINDPDYNEIVSGTTLRIRMDMLVENFLPGNAARVKTGTVFTNYTTGQTAPTIDGAALAEAINNSVKSGVLFTAQPATFCDVFTLNGVAFKGYYTDEDRNDRFIFSPVAKTDSNKTYVVYSYLTYSLDGKTHTVISDPVQASIADYNASRS